MDNIKETIEALIFASGEPVSKKDIIERIPSLTTRELNKIVEELKVKYGGDSGIVLASFNDKLQFTSNPRYGDTLVEVLTPIREKALSQSLLEVLSIIAYKQPVTRQEIEDIKGVQKEITWGSQIRSYVFMPYTLVKDHRTNYETGNVNAVMDGDLDGFINAYLKMIGHKENQ